MSTSHLSTSARHTEVAWRPIVLWQGTSFFSIFCFGTGFGSFSPNQNANKKSPIPICASWTIDQSWALQTSITTGWAYPGKWALLVPVARHTPGTFFSSPVYDTWYECVIMPLCSSPASGMVPNRRLVWYVWYGTKRDTRSVCSLYFCIRQNRGW